MELISDLRVCQGSRVGAKAKARSPVLHEMADGGLRGLRFGNRRQVKQIFKLASRYRDPRIGQFERFGKLLKGLSGISFVVYQTSASHALACSR